jgi:hypothetical protein
VVCLRQIRLTSTLRGLSQKLMLEPHPTFERRGYMAWIMNRVVVSNRWLSGSHGAWQQSTLRGRGAGVAVRRCGLVTGWKCQAEVDTFSARLGLEVPKSDRKGVSWETTGVAIAARSLCLVDAQKGDAGR